MLYETKKNRLENMWTKLIENKTVADKKPLKKLLFNVMPNEMKIKYKDDKSVNVEFGTIIQRITNELEGQKVQPKLVKFINDKRRYKLVDNNEINLFENKDYKEYVDINDDNIFVLLYSSLYFQGTPSANPDNTFYDNLNTSNNLSNVITKNENLENLIYPSNEKISTENINTIEENRQNNNNNIINQKSYISKDKLGGIDTTKFLPHVKKVIF